MKGFNILLVVLITFTACKTDKEKASTQRQEEEKALYASVGAEISPSDAEGSLEMLEAYGTLSASDTLNAKFSARVKEVCQAKGCWMRLALNDSTETMVRFKDYGFFVPKNIEGKRVIVSGKAFIEVLSVEDQAHYARDAGKSEQEIAEITGLKKNYGFEADGVLIEQEP